MVSNKPPIAAVRRPLIVVGEPVVPPSGPHSMRLLQLGRSSDVTAWSNDWFQFAKRAAEGTFYMLCPDSADELSSEHIQVYKYLTIQELQELNLPGVNVMLDQPAHHRIMFHREDELILDLDSKGTKAMADLGDTWLVMQPSTGDYAVGEFPHRRMRVARWARKGNELIRLTQPDFSERQDLSQRLYSTLHGALCAVVSRPQDWPCSRLPSAPPPCARRGWSR